MERGVLGHQRTGSHYGFLPDNSTIQNCGTHTYKTVVLHGATVQYNTVTYSDVVADSAWSSLRCMHDAQVLNVAPFAYSNRLNIAPEDSAVPDVGIFLYNHVAGDDRIVCDECRLINLG